MECDSNIALSCYAISLMDLPRVDREHRGGSGEAQGSFGIGIGCQVRTNINRQVVTIVRSGILLITYQISSDENKVYCPSATSALIRSGSSSLGLEQLVSRAR